MKKLINKLKLIILLLVIFSSTNVFAQNNQYSYSNNWGKPGLTIISSTSDKIELNYSIKNFSVTDLSNEQTNGERLRIINLPGVLLHNDAGMPDLPCESRLIAIPNGAVPKLKVVSYQVDTIKNFNLAPAPEVPIDIEDQPLKYEKNTTVYSSNTFYPEDPFQLSKVSKLRGVNVVSLAITPYQYNPVTKELKVFHDIHLELTTEGGDGTYGEARLNNPWWNSILENSIINYSSLPQLNTTKGTYNNDAAEYEYVIITLDNPDFIKWANTLAEFRREQGISTGVVTLSEIGGNSVATIEAWIDNAYRTWSTPPVAILLLGDYSTGNDGIISPKYTHPGNYPAFASDNGYADVDNDDLPDIVLARITANNAAELETMISKGINYESNPPTDPDFYNHPITALGWQTERWFQLCSEIIGGYFKNVKGKDTVRINAIYMGNPATGWSTATNTSEIIDYFGSKGLKYIPDSPNELGGWENGNDTAIINAINSGSFFLQHRDHGGYTGWNEPYFQNENIDSLTNVDNKLPFIFSINCKTGAFHNTTESFTEKFHRYTYNGQNSGALGLIAATEVSYSFVNDVFAWGMFDYMFPDFMPDNSSKLDSEFILPAFANASGKYFLATSSWPYNNTHKQVTYRLFHHHGDAFLNLYSEVPQALKVSCNDTHNINDTIYYVDVNSGATLALTYYDEDQEQTVILGKAISTDNVTSIQLDKCPPVGTKMLLTITKQNYFRYTKTITITGTALAPKVDFSATATSIVAGNSVTFTDLSTNNPTNWSWVFEGGTPSSSTKKNPSVTYNTEGIYPVSLKVSNSAGTDSLSMNNYIKVTPQICPVADFSANPTTIEAGERVQFTDLSTNYPNSWSWVFEGGTPATSTSKNPSVTYNQKGIYQVTLTASNSAGNDSKTKTEYITVKESNYTVNFILKDNWGSGFGAELNLANTSTKTFKNWQIEFDFEHNITDLWNGKIISHVGTHYVIGALDWNKTIRSGSKVTIGFNATPGGTIKEPKNIIVKFEF